MLHKTIELLSDEDLLKSKSLSGFSEKFLIEQTLDFIERIDSSDSKLFLFYLENDVLSIYNGIKNKPEYAYYTEKLQKILEVNISMEIVSQIKKILEEMQSKYFANQNNDAIVIKNIL